MINDINDALVDLVRVFPDTRLCVGFDVEHLPDGHSLPGFYARIRDGFNYYGATPDMAVRKLIRAMRITNVERYIRTQSYNDKAKGAA